MAFKEVFHRLPPRAEVPSERRKFSPKEIQLLHKIDSLAAKTAGLQTPEEIQDAKAKLQEKIDSHTISEKEFVPELLALAGRAIELTTGLTLYDTQYVCAYQLINGMPTTFPESVDNPKIEGRIAQLKSGEGKTLAVGAATIAAAIITQITGESVHTMTPNDYLATRDLALLGKAYETCGLKAGVILYGGDEQYIFDSSLPKSDNPESPFLHDTFTDTQNPIIGRRKVYTSCDIIYGQTESFIFDEQMDGLALSPKDMRQVKIKHGKYVKHKKAVAIIDEPDQTLIDKATTPEQLSSTTTNTTSDKQTILLADAIAQKLIPPVTDYDDTLLEGDYKYIGAGNGSVTITEEGYQHITSLLKEIDSSLTDNQVNSLLFDFNFYSDIYNATLAHAKVFRGSKEVVDDKEVITRASQPYAIRFEKGKDYIVKDGEILLLDQNTFRPLKDMVLQGLQQALEAKEGLEISGEDIILESTSIPSYLRSYRWVAGTTGTADSDRETFQRIYHLDVVKIPPHFDSMPTILPSELYRDVEVVRGRILERISLLTQEQVDKSGAHQPILILTSSIQEVEALKSLLKEYLQDNDNHNTQLSTPLTAANLHEEAAIINKAGIKNTITIATFVAGRGADIQLGGPPPRKEDGTLFPKDSAEYIAWKKGHDEVVRLGGLRILMADIPLTQREMLQAILRTARQGDPGTVEIFGHSNSELIQSFGGERAQKERNRRRLRGFVLPMWRKELPKPPDGQPDPNKKIGNDSLIERAQRKIAQRKQEEIEDVIHRDAVVNSHRKLLALKRKEVIDHPEEWLEAATIKILPKVINQRLSPLSKDLELLTIDSPRSRRKFRRLINDALTVTIPQLSGETMQVGHLGTVSEVQAFLGVKNASNQDLFLMSPREIEDAVVSYIQYRVKSAKQLPATGDSTKEKSHFPPDMVAFFKQLALQAFGTVWIMYLTELDNIQKTSDLQKLPYADYARESEKAIEGHLSLMEDQLLAYALALSPKTMQDKSELVMQSKQQVKQGPRLPRNWLRRLYEKRLQKRKSLTKGNLDKLPS